MRHGRFDPKGFVSHRIRLEQVNDGIAEEINSNAEKHGGKLRDKIKTGAKGAGTIIGEVLHSELGKELEKGIGPVAKNAANELAKQFGKSAGEFLHDQLSDSLKEIGVDFDGVIAKGQELADKFGIDEKKIKDVGDALGKIKKGEKFYCTSDGNKTFCQDCYANLPSILPCDYSLGSDSLGPPLYKRNLLKRKNEEEVVETMDAEGTKNEEEETDGGGNRGEVG
jgi:hypothetical protein